MYIHADSNSTGRACKEHGHPYQIVITGGRTAVIKSSTNSFTPFAYDSVVH